MPLDNTAKISDIITSLQGIQGINQKAELKSALVSKGVNALDTDSVSQLISKLNTLVLGKKSARGTTSLTSGGIRTITGLTFEPSIVIVLGIRHESILANSQTYLMVITKDGQMLGNQSINKMSMCVSLTSEDYGSSNNGRRNINGTSVGGTTYNGLITTDGFTFSSFTTLSGGVITTTNWIAIE